jgi:UDP-glucose 4-epimerase
MNFLITGGAGFLGSGLANLLVRQGHSVRVLDDLSTGNPDLLDPEIHFTRGDINDRPKLWTLLQEVDCVYHLAARVSVPESVLYPRDYNLVNVGGTVTLMEAIRDVGIKRLILVSSGAVYGSQAKQPLKESTIPHPESPYAVSKLSAEYYVRTIGRLWGIEAVCLRVFNAYGPGQHIPPTHAPVIPAFLRQAMHNGTLIIQGDGSQTRDYVYVDDVVSAMVAAATAPRIDQQVINIGSGKETSVRDLAKLAVKVTGAKPEVVTNPQANPGVSRMCADIWLATQRLKFKPLVPLETGLKLTFEQDENLTKMNGKSNGTTNGKTNGELPETRQP